MRIEHRIAKLEEHIPKKRSLEGLSVKEMTDDELDELICKNTDLKPEELTDEKLDELIAEGKRKLAVERGESSE